MSWGVNLAQCLCLDMLYILKWVGSLGTNPWPFLPLLCGFEQGTLKNALIASFWNTEMLIMKALTQIGSMIWEQFSRFRGKYWRIEWVHLIVHSNEHCVSRNHPIKYENNRSNEVSWTNNKHCEVEWYDLINLNDMCQLPLCQRSNGASMSCCWPPLTKCLLPTCTHQTSRTTRCQMQKLKKNYTSKHNRLHIVTAAYGLSLVLRSFSIWSVIVLTESKRYDVRAETVAILTHMIHRAIGHRNITLNASESV